MKITFPIHKRVIITSAAIILFFTVLLGFAINLLYKQSYLSLYTAELIAAMPRTLDELIQNHHQEVKKTKVDSLKKGTTKTPFEYMTLICKDKAQIWLSDIVNEQNLIDLCPYLPSQTPKPLLVSHDNKNYIIYKLYSPTSTPQHDFFILREVSEQLEQFTSLRQKAWVSLVLLFIITTAAIYASSYWSFRPLRQLVDELNDISASKREKLSDAYPSELEGVTEALNRMIWLQKQQTKRYSNAMEDLAHSLKSRLAATNAILYDTQSTQEQICLRVVEQISQMDDMVHYQLKRAMVGQRGLVATHTPLMPIISSLIGLFSKVYWDKPVLVETSLFYDEPLPLNKADLTELLGNLLENAYRLCLEHIRIRTYRNAKEVIIAIEDDGPGVPVEYRDSIFQRGVRADQLNPGSGIGLAVSADIVENYSGNLSVHTSSLEGAAFIIRFPLQPTRYI